MSENDSLTVGGTSPCFLHELSAAGVPSDRRQQVDVAHWRRAQREHLIATRMAIPAPARASIAADIARELERLVADASNPIVSVYWPIRGEPDLRSWMHAASARGLRIALPVAQALKQPLTFRQWHPGARMARGLWKIPYPADGPEATPTMVLAPLVGFDADCYRLGYGGGFFDRTLAKLGGKLLVIGVGYAQTRITTIYPQTHDIPMDWIVLGDAPSIQRGRPLRSLAGAGSPAAAAPAPE